MKRMLFLVGLMHISSTALAMDCLQAITYEPRSFQVVQDEPSTTGGKPSQKVFKIDLSGGTPTLTELQPAGEFRLRGNLRISEIETVDVEGNLGPPICDLEFTFRPQYQPSPRESLVFRLQVSAGKAETSPVLPTPAQGWLDLARAGSESMFVIRTPVRRHPVEWSLVPFVATASRIDALCSMCASSLQAIRSCQAVHHFEYGRYGSSLKEIGYQPAGDNPNVYEIVLEGEHHYTATCTIDGDGDGVAEIPMSMTDRSSRIVKDEGMKCP